MLQDGLAAGELLIGVLEVDRHWPEEATVRCGAQGSADGSADAGADTAESTHVLLPERSLRVRFCFHIAICE